MAVGLIAEAGPCEGRKSLLAEAEPGVFTRNHFITIVEGGEPSTTGQTLMMVWVTGTQSIMPKIRKRVVTEKASILEKFKEVGYFFGGEVPRVTI